MEYPPVKPHHKALHKLRQEFLYDKFKAAFHEILGLAGDDIFAQLEVYQAYCHAYAIAGNQEEAKKMIDKARELVSFSSDSQHKAFILIIQAKYNCMLGETDLSESQVDEALSLLEDKSGELYFAALNVKINNCLDLNKFVEGIRLCRETIEHADSSLLETLRNAHTNLGIIYDMLEEYGEAERHFQHSLTLSQQLGYLVYIASDYGNLASSAWVQYKVVKTNEEKLGESIRYGHLALETTSQTSESYFKAITLGNLGLAYAEANKFREAIKYGEEALSVARSINVNYLIGSASFWLGQTLEMKGQFAESLKQIEECIPYFEFLMEKDQVGVYRHLTLVCDHLALFEKGFKYSQKYAALLREFDEKSKAGIVYHNKLLGEKLQQHESELHKLQLRSIEDKMQTQAAQLVSQTELLSKFRDELREIVREYPSSDPGWRAVKEKLKELPCKPIDWEKFEAEFKAVHPEFTNKLYERYPTLTPMEVKLCSLLRLNLKSHEIGRLFCIAERGIETHRFNIRKKMGLEREQNLVTFLNSL